MGVPQEKSQDQKQTQKLTFKEYIKLEKDNNQKYEYHDGFVIAMAGGTRNHARIGKNVTTELDSIFKKEGDKCEVFNSDTKLGFQDKSKYLYPDVMVVCGDIEETRSNQDVTNPVLIVEVLSKSAEDVDREDKFSLYKHIPSLEYYVLISQDKPHIEIYRKIKSESNTTLWEIKVVEGIDENLLFPTLNIKISFKDIYRNVEFKKK